MKTQTTTFALSFLFVLMISFNLNASVLNFNEEEYIDDIPFSTEEVVEIYLNENDSVSFFEDEAYIDDIPFSTEKVVAEYNYQEALYTSFELTEEKYIDDIPFDTFNISRECNREYVPVFYSVVVTPLEF